MLETAMTALASISPLAAIALGIKKGKKHMNLPIKKIWGVLILLAILAFPIVTTVSVKAEPRQIIVPDDYPTITEALNIAANGDTIFVKKGTYNETMTINKAVTLIGEDRESTIINGQRAGTVVLIRHDNIVFTGFSVTYDLGPHSPQSIWMWGSRLAGIHMLTVKNCNISNNKVSNCGGGIWLYDARQNIVSGNTIVSNDYGLRIEASSGNSISKNVATGNWAGIRLISTADNELSENSMSNNIQNFGTTNEKITASPDLVDSSNLIDGRPIYYWVGVSNKNVPSDAAYVALVNCTSITAQGLNLLGNQGRNDSSQNRKLNRKQ